MASEAPASPARPEATKERALSNGLFRAAKWLWAGFALARTLAFALALLAITGKIGSQRMSYALVLITVLAELARIRSDANRSLAESLLRKLDLRNGFGWPISAAEFSDIEARCPMLANWLRRPLDDDYYGSGDDPAGDLRALRNTAESAWWSKHLAETMAAGCLTLLLVSGIASVVALVASIEASTAAATGTAPAVVTAASAATTTARLVAAVWMFLLPLGLLPLTIGYFRFAHAAESIEQRADAMRGAGHIDHATALKLVTDYHLIRAGSPMLPWSVWKLRRGKLNRLWDSRDK